MTKTATWTETFSPLLWGATGFCAMMAALAMRNANLGLEHLPLCLTGQAPVGQPALAFGHCAWCWATVAGAVMSAFATWRARCC